MARKKKNKETVESAPPAPKADDVAATAQRTFDRGDFATTRALLPKLRAEGHGAEADALWAKVKVDPTLLAIGLGAMCIAILAAILTLRS